jgi:hypothetical protein
MMSTLQVSIVGNACITRYNKGQGETLSIIIENNYDVLNAEGKEADRQAVVNYVVLKRLDIPE